MPRPKRTVHELMYRGVGRGNTPWLYLYQSLAAAHLRPAPKEITVWGTTFRLLEKRKVRK